MKNKTKNTKRNYIHSYIHIYVCSLSIIHVYLYCVEHNKKKERIQRQQSDKCLFILCCCLCCISVFFSFAFLTSLPPSFGSFDILLLSLLFPTPLRDLHTYIHTIYIRTFEYTNKLKEHHTNSCIAVVIVVVLFFLWTPKNHVFELYFIKLWQCVYIYIYICVCVFDCTHLHIRTL